MLRKLALLTVLLAAAANVQARPATRTPEAEISEVAIAMNFLTALGSLDFDAAAPLLDENAVLDLPYVNDGLIVRGREDILQFFQRSMSTSVSGITYKLVQAYPSPSAGALVLEISTQGRTKTGREYTNRLVGIFVIRGGKITMFREYFNSAKVG